MKLHFRTIGIGKPLIVMHGVFGSSDNWHTLGKDFAKHFKVYLVDLRNHGRSPHSDEFNYKVMVEDVIELMDDEGMDRVDLLGHSMGGKVAMHLATLYPERVENLIVVDIAPKHYPPHHQQIFAGFRSVNLNNLKSRKDADEQMATVISNVGVRQFILKNLDRNTDGHFQWKLNIEAIEKGAEEVGAGFETAVSFAGESLFISGSNSDYIPANDHQMIKSFFPNAEIISINGAGHWVHAEKPNELRKAVLNFLNEQR
ncbi:MAG: alpha/beta fold hydrolase [Ekhidna sp.]|nr:alpha/beta fold hydrolase [Ekhidna sp.]MBC6411286.1 alpha/beta fold hydrolase [Ekhidna sp.]